MIKVGDKTFELYISKEKIQDRVKALAKEIDNINFSEPPLLLCVLNGATFFSIDLMKAIQTDAELACVKLTSYQGMESSGKITEKLWLETPVRGRSVIVVEDIIDTGLTLKYIIEKLKDQEADKIITVALLDKKEARRHNVQTDLTGFEIPNAFVVGYGLDYNGLGRGLEDIYQLKQ